MRELTSKPRLPAGGRRRRGLSDRGVDEVTGSALRDRTWPSLDLFRGLARRDLPPLELCRGISRGARERPDDEETC